MHAPTRASILSEWACSPITAEFDSRASSPPQNLCTSTQFRDNPSTRVPFCPAKRVSIGRGGNTHPAAEASTPPPPLPPQADAPARVHLVGKSANRRAARSAGAGRQPRPVIPCSRFRIPCSVFRIRRHTPRTAPRPARAGRRSAAHPPPACITKRRIPRTDPGRWATAGARGDPRRRRRTPAAARHQSPLSPRTGRGGWGVRAHRPHSVPPLRGQAAPNTRSR